MGDDRTVEGGAAPPSRRPARRRTRGNKVLLGALAAATFVCYAIVLTVAPSHIQNLVLDGLDLLPLNEQQHNVAPRADQIDSGTTSGGHGSLPVEKYRTSKNAYAFLMAGCDPSNPSQYRGYIFNILAATYVLKDTGSTQDVVVMVRMAANLTVSTLPPEEESWLRAAGATIRYLPTVGDKRADSFYTATLDKFQVLDLVEYERVLFLDSDVLPICNLDYLFDLMPSNSAMGNKTTPMRNNLVIAWKTEPSNAGFMILQPGEGQLAELKEIIRKQAATEHARTKWPPFDEVMGWGHKVAWQNIYQNKGDKWNFYCAFSDQGLLYYWTKYHKRDVSIVINGLVEHWSEDEKGEPKLIGTSNTAELIDRQSCSHPEGTFLKGTVWRHSPYRDFNHFTGENKPWLPKVAGLVPKDTLEKREDAKNAMELWFYALRRQLEKLGIEGVVDVDHISKNLTKPPLGTYPAFILKRWADALANESETHLFETGDKFEPKPQPRVRKKVEIKRPAHRSHSALRSTRFDLIDRGIRNSTSANAYAFLMAGCDPSNPSQYRGYIFNILAATYVLKDTGSTQDVVVMVRMAANLTVSTLPHEEESWLRAAGVTIRYLPTVSDKRADSFYTATLDKFQVLDLVEYERVLFLDSDVLPICNLDYLFDLMPSNSAMGNKTTPMRNNLVIAWKTEPSNAGFMILQPGEGQLAELKEIIRKQAATEHARTKWPPFDEVMGWGHKVAWQNIYQHRGNRWDFYCAFSDQGLLYYWTKYHKRDVSIVINGLVEHWSEDDNGEPKLIGTSNTAELIDRHSCSHPEGTFLKGTVWRHSPYRDFNHFTGENKPWLPKLAHLVPKDTLKKREDAKDAMELWFYALRRQLGNLGIEGVVDVDHISKNLTKPPLGTYPAFILKRYADALANASETHLFETGDNFEPAKGEVDADGWCGGCRWYGTTCQVRLAFLVAKYQRNESEMKAELMEKDPQCAGKPAKNDAPPPTKTQSPGRKKKKKVVRGHDK